MAIQLNDTHPTLAIPELMRILLDEKHLAWDAAWDIAVRTFAYTNHTILPEALEKWPVAMMEHILPRHLLIIYQINDHFLKEVAARFPGDDDRMRRMSIVGEDGEKHVRMAHLAIVGSHSVNGVSALHSEILKDDLFHDFYEMWPERFNNKTNGITQRRWLKHANRWLADLISSKIGDGWITNLDELKKLRDLADDRDFQQQWIEVKRANKQRLAEHIFKQTGVQVSPDSMFDCQTKRIHEYKRQLLNVLHVITRYNRIKANPGLDIAPRTVIFSGKAAPSYYMAKLIIRLINAVASGRQQRPGRQPAAQGGLPAQLQCLAGRDDLPGRRPVRADLHRRHRGLRHRQHEIRPERRPDHRHPGRRQHRDHGRGRPRKHLHLRHECRTGQQPEERRLPPPGLLLPQPGAEAGHRS